jgi:signal transduction histidine kinase/ActR/RegA family two-component response regulator
LPFLENVIVPRLERLLAFAHRLQQASTFGELASIVREEVSYSVGYERVWLMVADDEEAKELRLLGFAGDQPELVWEVAPVLKVQGDPFLEEVWRSDAPVVVADARTDPRTDKAIVQALQNRTIVNIPLRLIDKPFGLFGVGTFGAEGPRPPDASQLEYLVGMAGQIVVAASRIRFLRAREESDRERQDFERRLNQVQKLESLGMLAGGIAHDFNNLLTVISASAGILKEELTVPALREDVTAILEAAGRAAELTQKLLAMSRAQTLATRTLDMNTQLRGLLLLVRRIFPESIEIDFVGGQELPLVEADAGQLDQVFLNILINARDAMPSGGRVKLVSEQVSVSSRFAAAHPWATPGRFVLVTISDSGVGMPAEVVERVFEPFFTTKGQRAGTGLGMAVSYGIVRQHKGMLLCSSQPGVGTSFKVYLPTSDGRTPEAATKLVRRPSPGSERVLVAEDDEFVRGVATRILQRGGYYVRAVGNGEAACALAAKEPFDLVILDVVMPGLPCHEVVKRLQALCPGIRILLSSGYTAGASIAPLMVQTGTKLLRKPYEPDQMLRAVRDVLDDAGDTAEGATAPPSNEPDLTDEPGDP